MKLKLTPDVTAQAASLIRAGLDVELAARQIGISPATWYSWQARGVLEGRANKPYREFRAAIDRARAENEAILVGRVAKAANAGSWRAATWLLERQYPERWSAQAVRDALEPVKQPTPAALIRDELAARRREQQDGPA
jgi:transposase